METTTDIYISILQDMQLLDREIAELQTALDAKLAQRDALAEDIHVALDALRAQAPRIKHGHNHRFSDAEIREFRRRAANGETPAALAREVRISGEAMRKIIHRVNYADVD